MLDGHVEVFGPCRVVMHTHTHVTDINDIWNRSIGQMGRLACKQFVCAAHASKYIYLFNRFVLSCEITRQISKAYAINGTNLNFHSRLTICHNLYVFIFCVKFRFFSDDLASWVFFLLLSGSTWSCPASILIWLT